MDPYDDAMWRPIPADMPQERLIEALSPAFGHQPELLAYYANPAQLNGLFTWTRYENPWQVAAFVLLRRLNTPEDSAPPQLREVAHRLGRAKSSIQTVSGQNGMRLELTLAHNLLNHRRVPDEVRLMNPLRALGLTTAVWSQLAMRAHVFSIDQLCEMKEPDLLDVPQIGSTRIDEVTTALATIGRSLRSG